MAVNCSVVIVSYYTNTVLFDCLDALLAEQNEDLSVQIIVVDNGNPEATKTQLAQRAATGQITYLQGQGNIGFAAGCNLGAAHAKADKLLLLNPDCIVQTQALQQLLRGFEQLTASQSKTLLSGWLVNPDGSEQRGLRRNLLTPLSLFVEMLPVLKKLPILGRHRLNLTGQMERGRYLTVGACSGACMLMPLDTYIAIGGMDEHYFLHVDDLDFCRRWHDDGGYIMIDRQSLFVHQKGTSVASQQRVERHKRDGFVRYFSTHHRKFWRSPLGWGLYLAIQLNYLLSSKKSV